MNNKKPTIPPTKEYTLEMSRLLFENSDTQQRIKPIKSIGRAKKKLANP